MERPAPRAPPARRGARAVADLGALRRSGFRAWLLWSFAHLWFLVGFRNRLVVFLDWALAYATFERGARLITDARAPEAWRPRVPLGRALTALLLLAVLSTAGFVHVIWQRAANRPTSKKPSPPRCQDAPARSAPT